MGAPILQVMLNKMFCISTILYNLLLMAHCRDENPNFDIGYEHEIMILLSGQGDFGDPEFINVFECTCEGDLCNSACKQTTAICNSASKKTIAAVFTWAFVVFASVIL